MTVAELIEQLKKLPQHIPVYLEEDDRVRLLDGAVENDLYDDDDQHLGAGVVLA